MNSLLLSPVSWDLMADLAGNIAMAESPYAVAQDVASACRTFFAELWYDKTQGLPYFQQILGRRPAPSLIKAKMVAAAMTVPTVASAICVLSSFKNGVLSGAVIFTTVSGEQVTILVSNIGQILVTDAGFAIVTSSGQSILVD
jgi:hypothetical protein